MRKRERERQQRERERERDSREREKKREEEKSDAARGHCVHATTRIEATPSLEERYMSSRNSVKYKEKGENGIWSVK